MNLLRWIRRYRIRRQRERIADDVMQLMKVQRIYFFMPRQWGKSTIDAKCKEWIKLWEASHD